MSELNEAIQEMRNMRQAYDQISAAAEAYNTGKTKLAQNITAKGVQASATETLPELAEKVAAITQETYEINGGEMYAKQLFGSLEKPNYWNLYEVMAQLLSDSRLVNYGGILLAEHYKGYASLALSGAGSGGAYVVSDKDSNGNYILYTEDTTHIWNTEDDGKGNRWVAYCFAGAGHGYQITNTDTCPRSIHIGRHVGVIESLVNGRVSQLIVTDGNILDGFIGNYPQNWDKKTIIRNVTNRAVLYNPSCESIYLEVDTATDYLVRFGQGEAAIQNIIVRGNSISHIFRSASTNFNSLKRVEVYSEYINGRLVYADGSTSMRYLSDIILNYEYGRFDYQNIAVAGGQIYPNIYINYINNDKTKTAILSCTVAPVPKNIILKNGWRKPFTLTNAYNTPSDNIQLTEESVYRYILQRLKQDEPNCGVGITISLGSKNLNILTSEESQELLALLRGTYGYTFA